MEFVTDVLMAKMPLGCNPNLVPIVSVGTESSVIRINGTELELEAERAVKFVQALDRRKYTVWKYSERPQEAEESSGFSANWTLLLSFVGAVVVFHGFGVAQKEGAYNTVSVCLLNVFRLSLGQPLRKDPRRWSMKFVLLSWVLFQMHAAIIYQGVLMSYQKSYDSHKTDILVIPNGCLAPFQRPFETGLIFQPDRKRGATVTLEASSQTGLLLRVVAIGWVSSAVVLLVEIWADKNWRQCQRWLRGLEAVLPVRTGRHLNVNGQEETFRMDE